MGHIYTATLPDSGKSRLADQPVVPLPPPPGVSMDRVERTLRNRIDAAIRLRREAACAIDETAAFVEWTHQRNRENKLRRILIAYLSRPF